MKNISFDNPYLLLAAIPLLLLIVIPFVIAIRKENRSRAATLSLILHLTIILCVVLALAGTVLTLVMTETQVYVVADVSYSSNRNLDEIDAYIEELQEKLPRNSKVGLICFGKDQKLVTELGGTLASVQNSGVDDSATDISSALDYAATLFGEGVIKRVVLITDGKETDSDATRNLIASVENLHANGIYLDAVYLDNNIPADAREVQLTGVDFTPSTYLNHEATADLLIQSNQETRAIVRLLQNGSEIEAQAVSLVKGYNVVNFTLPTSQSGDFDYRLEIEADDDTAPFNNVYSFTQSVTGKLNVLLVSGNPADLERAQALYGDDAVIDAYIKKSDVPCSVEALCKYDEIILSDLDVRELKNFTAFVDAVDQVVSKFGKSLVTMGDLKIQNKTDEILTQLEDMLPVKFGNNDQDPKLYAIVIDTSRSMQNFSRLRIAKAAAIQLLELLGDEDYVMVVNFWGEINVLQAPIQASRRNEVAEKINAIEPYQGTFIGTALSRAGELMVELPYDQKQIMLISDGMSYTLENDVPADVVEKLYKEYGIVTSAINPAARDEGKPTLHAVTAAGGGKYYEIRTEEDLEAIMFAEIADDLTESVIEKQTAVAIKSKNDGVLNGIVTLPDIYGYAYAKAKASANTVLTVDYVRSSGTVVKAPLYAYWDYGNGRVSSFTSSLSGEWTRDWVGGSGSLFMENVMVENTPRERIDYPYTLNVSYDGTYSEIEIIPATLNPYATVDATVTLPGGETVTRRLAFDSSKYSYKFETPLIGKYTIKVVYTVGQNIHEATTVFNISYSPEYDCFAVFDPSPLHAAIRNRGTVTEGNVPTLKNDENEVATYSYTFTVPLMIAAVVLFVVDIAIRKLKIEDIRSFFGKKASKGGAK